MIFVLSSRKYKYLQSSGQTPKYALFEEFLHTATLYAIWKPIVCSLRFGMMWSVKMMPFFIN